MTAEEQRLEESRERQNNWKRWGPYLSERAWGTVREDYSPGGSGLGVLPARSRAVARLSLERGRHRRHLRSSSVDLLRHRVVERAGSDPQGAPVRPDRQRGQSRRGRQGVLLLSGQHADALVHEVSVQVPAARVSIRATRRREPAPQRVRIRNSSWLDTGVFADNRYFDVFVEYAKASCNDILIRITAVNRADVDAPLHLLPTIWFRNTWSWGHGTSRPELQRVDNIGRPIALTHGERGLYTLHFEGAPELLFTENDTNRERIFGIDNTLPFVKDSINDYVVHSEKEAVNPAQRGTKAAGHYTARRRARASRRSCGCD